MEKLIKANDKTGIPRMKVYRLDCLRATKGDRKRERMRGRQRNGRESTNKRYKDKRLSEKRIARAFDQIREILTKMERFVGTILCIQIFKFINCLIEFLLC